MGDAVLYLVSVVDVDVPGRMADTLIDLNDGAEQGFDTHAALERRRHQGRTQQGGQHLQVQRVTTTLELVVHVECYHHRNIHIQQLGGQIEVALDVGRVNDVDDDVRCLFRQVLAHVEFLWRVARQRIGAWQVGQVELVAEIGGMGLGGIDSDA